MGDTERWTLEQYHAYLARGAPESSVPHFLALDADAPEDLLRSRIQALCVTTGHLYFHPYHSKRSTAGFPDDVILHPEGGPLWLIELKRQDGMVSAAQQRWLDALARVTHVETAVWRPADWEQIYTRLISKG